MRTKLVSFITYIYEDLANRNGSTRSFDNILLLHNVDFDSRDPQEGIFKNMSDDDIRVSLKDFITKNSYIYPEYKYLAIIEDIISSSNEDIEWARGFECGCAYAHKDCPKFEQ